VGNQILASHKENKSCW